MRVLRHNPTSLFCFRGPRFEIQRKQKCLIARRSGEQPHAAALALELGQLWKAERGGITEWGPWHLCRGAWAGREGGISKWLALEEEGLHREIYSTDTQMPFFSRLLSQEGKGQKGYFRDQIEWN